MSDARGRRGRRRAVRLADGIESLGLVVLLLGLPYSEAMKSLGFFLAAFGFVGKLILGAAAPRAGWTPLAALGGYFAAAVISVLAARPGYRVPRELLTLAMTIGVYPIVLDACARESRRVVLVWALIVGAVAAVLQGYFDYMAQAYVRLRLPSIENAVPAAEYLGAVLAMVVAILLVEWRATVVGPSLGFALGAIAIGLLMTKSRGPLIGSVVGSLTAVGVGSGRKRVALCFLVAMIAAVWVFASVHPNARVVERKVVGTSAAATRLENWRQTSELFAERPLTGHGYGSFPRLGVVYHDALGPEHAKNAHQMWLELASETGLLGCGAFMVFLVLGIGEILRAIRAPGWRLGRAISVGALAGTAALLAAGLFSVTTDAEPGMLLFALTALGATGRQGRDVGQDDH